MNDEQKARLFNDGIRRLQALIEQKDEIVGRIRSHRKEMKSEGFLRPEVDYGLWTLKHDGKDLSDDVAMRLRIAAWMNQPLGFQATLDLAAQ